MKNLFDYATKELSQDAFLRWLFENYNSENKEVNKVCEQLFNKFTKDELDFSKIANLTTTAQWKNIDISIWFSIQGKEYLIVIEDKTTTEEHHQQLMNYNKKIQEHVNWLVEKNKTPIEKVYKVFYKTAEIGEEKKRIEKAGWENIFGIKEIYAIFKDVRNTQSDILDDYAEHIRDINTTYYNFECVPFNKWLYNNTIFQAYAQKKLKADNVGYYNGIYVYAGLQKKFTKFTVELLFEFRHWEIVAKVIYWRNEGQSYDIVKLRSYFRSINIQDCYPFPVNEAYGNKRLTRIIKNPEYTDFFENYDQFNQWVFDCKTAFEKITSKIDEDEFTAL